jgi:uncharacterized paraquat-inducible protein A
MLEGEAMQNNREPVRVTVTCEYCDALNDLTASSIEEAQEVRCSRCGAVLGSFGQLVAESHGRPKPVTTKRSNF